MRLAAAFLAVAAAGLAQTPDCSLVSGWKQQGPARTYAADNLFEYMDGNAEGYLLYHFVRMNGVNCALGEETLVFDVSEMENAEWAYGMFASNRDSRVPTEKIGVQAQIVPRRGILVKDKYFIEINSPDKEDPDSLRTFLQAMEKRVAGSSDPPEALGWFPAERLVAGSVRMVPESVLGIGALKRGYVAEYDFGKAFVVREASPESAAAVMTKLRARFQGTRLAQIADEGFEVTDQYLGRLCFFRKGRYIAGFAGLAEGQLAVPPSEALAARIP